MKKSLLLLLALTVSMTGTAWGQETASKKSAVDETVKKAAIGKVAAKAEKKPVVQIAILLDNSGSMSGLIDQARSELWKVVQSSSEKSLTLLPHSTQYDSVMDCR